VKSLWYLLGVTAAAFVPGGLVALVLVRLWRARRAPVTVREPCLIIDLVAVRERLRSRG
jgi:hypothetical protein